MEDAISFALLYFVGTNLIDQVVKDIAQVHGIQHAESEIDGELQPGLTRGRLNAIAVLEQQHAEAVEAGVLQREAIFGFIHAEAAGAAGASGEENIVVENLLARNAFLFQKLEVLHQVAHSEICGIALAVVPILFADLEGRHVRHGQFLATIAATLKDGADQIFVLPGEATKQNGDLVSLLGGKRTLHRAVEMVGRVQAGDLAQAHAFGGQSLFNLGIVFNLNQVSSHYLPPADGVLTGCNERTEGRTTI